MTISELVVFIGIGLALMVALELIVWFGYWAVTV